ncbi:MAG: type II CAAX endopeptidase family protein [Candidatus Baltobacteraceae bacterium]
MSRAWAWPILGTLAAIAVTSIMDATASSAFSALPLFPLLAIFAYLQKFSLKELGFTWGGRRAIQAYAMAILYPIAVMGILVAVAAAAGAMNPAAAPQHKHATWLLVLTNVAITIPLALLTEEGFFRGWLWCSIARTKQTPIAIIVLTSLAFALWHWSSVILPTGYNPPLAQVPVIMLNAAVIGAIWAMLRLLSGSLVVSSISHGLWNGLAYVLFGFGSNVGTLGIANTAVFGPEIGFLGLALNIAAAALLWRWGAREGLFDRRPFSG